MEGIRNMIMILNYAMIIFCCIINIRLVLSEKPNHLESIKVNTFYLVIFIFQIWLELV